MSPITVRVGRHGCSEGLVRVGCTVAAVHEEKLGHPWWCGGSVWGSSLRQPSAGPGEEQPGGAGSVSTSTTPALCRGKVIASPLEERRDHSSASAGEGCESNGRERRLQGRAGSGWSGGHVCIRGPANPGPVHDMHAAGAALRFHGSRGRTNRPPHSTCHM